MVVVVGAAAGVVTVLTPPIGRGFQAAGLVCWGELAAVVWTTGEAQAVQPGIWTGTELVGAGTTVTTWLMVLVGLDWQAGLVQTTVWGMVKVPEVAGHQ